MRPEVIDVSGSASGGGGPTSSGRGTATPRPLSRPPVLLTAAVVVVLLAGLLGALSLRGRAAREAAADRGVTVSVSAADPGPVVPADRGGRATVGVSLQLTTSVPVVVVTAGLDGGPPISRPAPVSPSRRPVVLVRWQVLCAEVGSVLGPLLLDVRLRTGSGTEERRIRFAVDDPTADVGPVSRVFRLRAAESCAAGPPASG